MTATTEAPFTVSAHFCAIRGETLTELESRLRDFVNSDNVADLIKEFRDLVDPYATGQAGATLDAAVATATAVLGATPVAPAAVAGPEVVSGKYGDQWTYGLAEAPQLPDGRGAYVKRAWTSQKGKRLTAWVDPSKGPKPFSPGAAEAELIWI